MRLVHGLLAGGLVVSAYVGLLVLAPRQPAAEGSAAPPSLRSAAAGPDERIEELQRAASARRAPAEPSSAAGRPAGALTLRIVSDCPSERPWRAKLTAAEGATLQERLVRETATWSGLAGGRYEVEVSGPGWSRASAHASVDPSASSPTVVEVEMEPNALAQGYVLAEESGAPLDAFEVRPETRRLGQTGVEEVRGYGSVSYTEAGGAFCLAGLPTDGDWIRLLVSAPGYVTGATEWWPTSEAVHAGFTVALRSTEDGVARVVGRVVLEDASAPAAGFTVRLVDGALQERDVVVIGGVPQVPSSYDRGDDFAESVTTTGERGEFALATAVEGPVRLLAHHPDHGFGASEVVEAVRGEDARVELLVPSGGSLSGTVWVHADPDRAADVRTVVVRGPRETRMLSLDETRRFRARGLAPGTYTLVVQAMLDAPSGHRRLLPVTTRSLTLQPHEEREVDLHYGSGLGGSSLRASFDAPGAAGVTGWQAALLEAGGEPIAYAYGTGSTSSFPDVPEGTYTLVAVGLRGERPVAMTARAVEIGGAAAGSVRLSAENASVRLPGLGSPGGPWSLRATTDLPAFDAFLAQAGHGALDPDGDLTLWGLPEGRYVVAAGGKEVAFRVPAER